MEKTQDYTHPEFPVTLIRKLVMVGAAAIVALMLMSMIVVSASAQTPTATPAAPKATATAAPAAPKAPAPAKTGNAGFVSDDETSRVLVLGSLAVALALVAGARTATRKS